MMEHLAIRELNKEEIEEVYREHMPEAFPAAEVKPLSVILAAVDKGTYTCYGLFDDDLFVGYGFFFRAGENCQLLDYYATLPHVRSKGYGAAFLKMFAALHPDMTTFGEVEAVESTEDEGEKALRQRRRRFYERNGFLLTNVRAILFGVEYQIIMQNGPEGITDEEIMDCLWMIYQELFPYSPKKVASLIRLFIMPQAKAE